MSLLRRWLKITCIFKAAEESQDRQRLDSLPPGRSSLSPPSPSLMTFATLRPPLKPFHLVHMTTYSYLNHIFRHVEAHL